MIDYLETDIDDCYLITRKKRFQDNRGVFEELWSEAYFPAFLPKHWAQDNLSFSKAEVLRGLHVQRQNPQGKLVTCVQGKIWDVCVDVRPESRTFRRWVSAVLDHKNGQSLYCPPGTAHGFAVLSSRGALLHYKCSTLHEPTNDWGIRYDDKALGIIWPVYKPIISDKDLALPALVDYLKWKK